MGLPNRDELEGKFDKAKGHVKETAGRVLNDSELESEGEADQTTGSVKEGIGKVRRNVGEAVEDLGDSIKR